MAFGNLVRLRSPARFQNQRPQPGDCCSYDGAPDFGVILAAWCAFVLALALVIL